MDPTLDAARSLLSSARDDFSRNVSTLTLEEALFAAGGYRSVIGIVKHIGGWLHVYRSYALEEHPRHWAQTDWPRGRIDTIEPTHDYLDEVLAWVHTGFAAWDAGLAAEPRDRMSRFHWGEPALLSLVVVRTAQHVIYHTGELNMLLSIARGEAWEYTEEVEENHISTYGHGVPPPWMTEQQRRAHEEHLRRAAETRPSGT